MTIALAMRLELKRLAQRHQHQQTPSYVPLEDPTPHAQVLAGYALTTSVDGDRTRFRPFALSWLPWKLPPLLHKHDAPAGTIDALSYDDAGCLRIRATVTHPEARRCNAFSVGARILTYELYDVDGPNFYALVKSAELTEVSTTDVPANVNARVVHRWAAAPPTPANEFYDLLVAKVQCLQKMVPLLVKEEPPPPKPTSFRQLVQAMNAQHGA